MKFTSHYSTVDLLLYSTWFQPSPSSIKGGVRNFWLILEGGAGQKGRLRLLRGDRQFFPQSIFWPVIFHICKIVLSIYLFSLLVVGQAETNLAINGIKFWRCAPI